MAKSRQQRKEETEQFVRDHINKFHDILIEDHGSISTAWEIFCNKHLDHLKIKRDQVYRQRMVLVKQWIRTYLKDFILRKNQSLNKESLDKYLREEVIV